LSSPQKPVLHLEFKNESARICSQLFQAREVTAQAKYTYSEKSEQPTLLLECFTRHGICENLNPKPMTVTHSTKTLKLMYDIDGEMNLPEQGLLNARTPSGE